MYSRTLQRRDTSVDIATGTDRSQFNSRQGKGFFSYSLLPNFPTQRAKQNTPSGVNQQGREADHSYPVCAEVRNSEAITLSGPVIN
jgi:hypothetical protein